MISIEQVLSCYKKKNFVHILVYIICHIFSHTFKNMTQLLPESSHETGSNICLFPVSGFFISLYDRATDLLFHDFMNLNGFVSSISILRWLMSSRVQPEKNTFGL